MEDHDTARALEELIQDVLIMLPDTLTWNGRTWTHQDPVRTDATALSVGIVYQSGQDTILARVSRDLDTDEHDLRVVAHGVVLVEQHRVPVESLGQVQDWIDACRMHRPVA